ncbi:unnamed protein product (macronuclear) [Paramecium tetraurelia]|uniref:Transmembrane protein n=1 Tax=Paramecium tetraurelia TaxID=5888 RepID=A0DG80_PARTE|nr:uncharacterized protein GSPATT00002176001 [Paramecium tetraurelia]CAK82047.1 unnamed protein product [Paramecium tetraurelia]|eukprot:XP_001449444.1 hypothetical protein (macronuclear) [Paramecium tetraurelia strain d4-2]
MSIVLQTTKRHIIDLHSKISLTAKNCVNLNFIMDLFISINIVNRIQNLLYFEDQINSLQDYQKQVYYSRMKWSRRHVQRNQIFTFNLIKCSLIIMGNMRYLNKFRSLFKSYNK